MFRIPQIPQIQYPSCSVLHRFSISLIFSIFDILYPADSISLIQYPAESIFLILSIIQIQFLLFLVNIQNIDVVFMHYVFTYSMHTQEIQNVQYDDNMRGSEPRVVRAQNLFLCKYEVLLNFPIFLLKIKRMFCFICCFYLLFCFYWMRDKGSLSS